MADTTVYGSGSSLVHTRQWLRWPYRISETVWAMILLDSWWDLRAARTTDWWANRSVSSAFANVDTRQVACFFDQEVPWDTWTKIHATLLNFTGAATGTCLYWDYDISTGTLGTVRIIASSLTVHTTSTNNRISIGKSRNGNLYVGFVDGTEQGFYRSTDAWVNRSSRTVVTEWVTAYDYIMFFPANTADTADLACIFWDVSANAVSIKMYDDSANTWTETAIGSAVESVSYRSFDASVRHSDGHIILCIYNAVDVSTADIDCYDINPSTISSVSISTKTDVLTNLAEAVQVAVVINQQNDYIYVGTLVWWTWESSTHGVFYISTDWWTTRGSQQAYTETARDHRYISWSRTVWAGGWFIQFSLYEVGAADIFVNLVNDIFIASSFVSSISKINWVLYTNISKLNWVNKANINKVNWIV